MQAGCRVGRVLVLARNWWVVAVRGALAILFGILLVALGLRLRRLHVETEGRGL